MYEQLHHDKFGDRLFSPLRLARKLRSWEMNPCATIWTQFGDQYVPTAGDDCRLQTIGTLSVSNQQQVEDRLVDETLRYITEHAAPAARSATMPGLVERLLTLLKQAAGSTHAAIHVGNSLEAIFEGRAHRIKLAGTRDLNALCDGVADLPRPDGIGAEAAAAGHPILFRSEKLAQRNPKLWANDVQACLVAPLMAEDDRVIGIAYFHYDREPSVVPPEDIFSTCGAVLGTALRVGKPDRLREYVLAEARSCASQYSEPPGERMKRLANFTMYLLGASHVSILVNQTARHAGRYLAGSGIDTNCSEALALDEALRNAAPYVTETFVNHGSAGHPLLARGSFATEQRIEATVAMPLFHDGARVGVVFIDHHAPQAFGDTERQLYRNVRSLIQAGVAAQPLAANLAAVPAPPVSADVLSPKWRESLPPSNVLSTLLNAESGLTTKVRSIAGYPSRSLGLS